MTLKRDFASKWKLFQVASLSCKKGFHFEMKTASKIVSVQETVVQKNAFISGIWTCFTKFWCMKMFSNSI